MLSLERSLPLIIIALDLNIASFDMLLQNKGVETEHIRRGR
jgi:hypothetical protein